MKSFFSLYEAIAQGVKDESRIQNAFFGERWASVDTEKHYGVAMSTPLDSIEAAFPEGIEGISLKEAAVAVKSWNLKEASLGLAACNAYYNSLERMERLNCAEPYENYCTQGLDMRGKTVGLVGHLHMTPQVRAQVGKIYTLERMPQEGDYPDSACDFILPQCDVVIITGNAITNKTLPHLLDLCRDAVTILTGPSVPMCPELLDFGIDRLAGMAIWDREGMDARVRGGLSGNPYCHGKTFLLKK